MSLHTFQRDRAAVLLYNRPRQVQPQAKPARAQWVDISGSIEALKHLRVVGLGNADTPIGNGQTGLGACLCIGAARGQPERAARLGGGAEALREAIGVPLAPEQQAGHDEAMQTVRETLGEEAFATAWAEGRALPPDDAVALALEDHAERSQGE